MKIEFILLCIVTTCISVGCGKVYHNTTWKIDPCDERKIAIIPPKLYIENRKVKDMEAYKKLLKEKSFEMQAIIFDSFRRGENIIIKDIESTNEILEANRLKNNSSNNPIEICSILAVDEIIFSDFFLTDPDPEIALSAAFATGLGLLRAPKRKSKVSFQIYEKTSNRVMWNYEQRVFGDDPISILDSVLEFVNMKSPYQKECRS